MALKAKTGRGKNVNFPMWLQPFVEAYLETDAAAGIISAQIADMDRE